MVVPVFNRPQLLREAVESVFRQTITDWELVIADDGSDLPTRQYLEQLAAHPQVRVVSLSHAGIPARARNAALSESRGRYIAFLDSDDVWEPRKLETQLQLLETQTGCEWSYSAFVNVDGLGKALATEARRVWKPYAGDVFQKILAGEVAIRTPTVVATRRLIVAAGMFDESIRSAEDYDLWLRLALLSPLAVCNEPLVKVRFHQDHHSADWASAYAGQDRTFRKLQASVDARRRSLLRRERAMNALRFAYEHAIRRQRAGALATLVWSSGFSWHYLRWWVRSVRIVLRAFVPEPVLLLYRRHRGSVA